MTRSLALPNLAVSVYQGGAATRRRWRARRRGSALRFPARHGRAAADQLPQISQAHPAARQVLPRPSFLTLDCPARGHRV